MSDVCTGLRSLHKALHTVGVVVSVEQQFSITVDKCLLMNLKALELHLLERARRVLNSKHSAACVVKLNVRFRHSILLSQSRQPLCPGVEVQTP